MPPLSFPPPRPLTLPPVGPYGVEPHIQSKEARAYFWSLWCWHRDQLDLPWRALVSSVEYLCGEDALCAASASAGGHQAYACGLLEHTTEVLTLAHAIAALPRYQGAVDYNLLRTGAMLHDLGKVQSYAYRDGSWHYTAAESQTHHIGIGLELLVRAQERQYKNLCDAGWTDAHWSALRHIIISHHEIPERGSMRAPQSVEAWIIHFADMTSAYGARRTQDLLPAIPPVAHPLIP